MRSDQCKSCGKYALKQIAYDGRGNKVPKGSTRCYKCGFMNIKGIIKSGWENTLERTAPFQKVKRGRYVT